MRRLGHRPELDGLRGVAILLVMLAHLGLPGFASGGVAGVTLFFALSGFLITTLLLEEHADTGRVSLGSFYRRRALRLLPALIALIVVANVLMLLAHHWRQIGWASLAAIFYSTNWARAAGGLNSPWLGHTWSLAIEEQFYLVWPVLLVLLIRRRRLLMTVAVTGVVVAIVERALLWGGSGHRIYFGTDTRMDALLLGALLAFVVTRSSFSPSKGLRVAAAAGVVLLVLATSLTDREASFVAGPTLAAVAGVLLLGSLFMLPGQQIGRLLAIRPLAFTGRISYGLYIWHVPFRNIFLPVFAADPLWARGLILFGFAYAAALLSYRYIEQPFLQRKRARGPIVQRPGTTARPVLGEVS